MKTPILHPVAASRQSAAIWAKALKAGGALTRRRYVLLAAALPALAPASALACAACYGQSDSPMAQGMNWGIFSLLGIIGLVLGGVSAFFIYLAKRGAATQEKAPRPQPVPPPATSWIPATSKV